MRVEIVSRLYCLVKGKQTGNSTSTEQPGLLCHVNYESFEAKNYSQQELFPWTPHSKIILTFQTIDKIYEQFPKEKQKKTTRNNQECSVPWVYGGSAR